MVQIIIIQNPLEPKIHDVTDAYYTGKSITSYCHIQENTAVFLNGQRVVNPEHTFPPDGSQLILAPIVAGGSLGKVLGFVAMVALTAWSGAILGGSGLFGMAIKGYTLGAYLASGAVMYLGGRLINSVFPQHAASLSWQDAEHSQTYGWDLPAVATQEGGVIGETYGTCIPQPQLLEEHVETSSSDGKQYLNLLYCGGYGEIDSITDIRIDSTPIENFKDVQVETKLGTNDQTPVSFFANTPVDQSVGLMLDLNQPLIRTTDSTAACALELTFEWNNGLYHLNDDGSYSNASVSVQVDYRKTGTETWQVGGTYTFTNGSSDAFRRSIKIASELESAQYDVRVNLISKDSGSRNMTLTSWSILTAYNNGMYARPNKVLVGLRILATNQLSGGVPNINWRQTRTKVYVYNPKEKQYEVKRADNPIWAAYDILHGCRYLKNMNTGKMEYVIFGCRHDQLDAYYEEWKAAADYADEMVPDEYGNEERRFQFDAYFDTSQKRFDAAVKAAAVGHSSIILHGTRYGIVTDKPGRISQVFAEGRTTVSSVNGTFTSRDERAKSVEIQYNDRNNDFKNTVFTLRSKGWEQEDTQDNTAKLELFGVSRRSQAYREGVRALATNERQLQFVELSTDIDGVVCEYGDIVGYAHTVSRIGIASGRLVAATTSTITLDKAVSLEPDKTYEIYITLADDTLVKREIATPTEAVTTSNLTLTVPLEKAPARYDNYAFGETNKAIKPYRVVGASRDGEMLVKLKLAEYDEAIYSTDLNYDRYPDVDYTNYSGLNIKGMESDITQSLNSNENTTYIRTKNGYEIVVTKKDPDNIVYTFPTEADMVANGLMNINFGSRVRTLGYYHPNDGGGAEYICRYVYDAENNPWAIYLGESAEYEYKVVTDIKGTPLLDADGNYVYETDSKGAIVVRTDAAGLPKRRKMYAVICEDVVNYRMFGAKLDGLTDDDKALRLCHAYQMSRYEIEPETERKHYLVSVENHHGTIRKDNAEPIVCAGNIDLSGSKLIIQNCNATWFGFYLWGDNDSDFMTYEPLYETKQTYRKDNLIIGTEGNLTELKKNSLISMKETPYAVRDDDGYLYSNPRYELLLYTMDGMLANPITYDWGDAGGMEIKTPISDYTTHEVRTETINSQYEISFTRLPNAHYSFHGCQVEFQTDADKYCSVLWCKCHNAHISGFSFYPDTKQMHNTVFKNTMIYIWGAYNVEVSNIVGFNAAGKKQDETNATSGYVIRATNCLNLHLHDISVQGYWGATAMNCVKDVHIERISINRIDIHNYFYNLYIDHCNIFNHGVQIGEGRGICQITNSNFYVNHLDADSYPGAHILELNATYGRIFEGKIYIADCNAYLKKPNGNEFDVIKCDFSQEAVSTLDTFKWPATIIRDCYFHSYTPDTYLVYNMVSGVRTGKTSTKAPTNIKDWCKDTGNDDKGSLTWKYLGRGLDWVDDGNTSNHQVYKGEIIRTYQKTVASDNKTAFFGQRYYLVTQAGNLQIDSKTEANMPNDTSGNEFSYGTAKLKHVRWHEWQANKKYFSGDICYIDVSPWLPVYCWECVSSGHSNGYRPVHTSGKVIEGKDIYPQNLDACWWQYLGKKSDIVTADFQAGAQVEKEQILFSDHKLYRVLQSGKLGGVPPQNTDWDGSFRHGTATLKFLGKEWSPKTWWGKDHYCISVADDGSEAIYQLVDQDGITSGEAPVRGNARCVDGDIIWEWQEGGEHGNVWQPQTAYNIGDIVYANGNTYCCVFDGKLEMPSQIVLENITTNMQAGGDVFSFYAGGTSVPIKTNASGKWRIKIDNVEMYRLLNFPDGYFGVSSNPAPTILDADMLYGTKIYTRSEMDALLAKKADVESTYTKDEIAQLLVTSGGSGGSSGEAGDTIYTKNQIDTLLSKKADIEHTHPDYVKLTDFTEALKAKLDVTASHASKHIGTHDMDETGLGDGMVLYYDAETKTYKFKEIPTSSGDTPTPKPVPEEPIDLPLQNVIHTKSVYCDKTFTLSTDETFKIPDGAKKFRLTVIPATSTTVSADTYLEFRNSDGTLTKKVLWSDVATNGIIAACAAGKIYAFRCSITTSSATTLNLSVDVGEKINALTANVENVPAYDSVKEIPLITLTTKTLTATGSGSEYSCEDWSGDFRFTIPQGVTKFRFKVSAVDSTATLGNTAITFVNEDWTKKVKIRLPAVLSGTAGKTYACCPWTGVNKATDIIYAVEVGGEVESSPVTDTTVLPTY